MKMTLAKGLAHGSVIAFFAASAAAMAQTTDLRAREGYTSYGAQISRDNQPKDAQQEEQPREGNDQAAEDSGELPADTQQSARDETTQTAAVESDISAEGNGPRVEVQNEEPKFSVTQEEPEVEVKPAESADIQIIQEGEDTPPSEEERSGAGSAGGAETDSDQSSLPQQQAQDTAAADAQPVDEATSPDSLQRYMGRTLVNAQGEELGEISQIVRDKQTQELKVVVAAGGFLGMGAKKVALPLEQISVEQEKAQLRSGVTRQELEQMAGYQEANHEKISVQPQRG